MEGWLVPSEWYGLWCDVTVWLCDVMWCHPWLWLPLHTRDKCLFFISHVITHDVIDAGAQVVCAAWMTSSWPDKLFTYFCQFFCLYHEQRAEFNQLLRARWSWFHRGWKTTESYCKEEGRSEYFYLTADTHGQKVGSDLFFFRGWMDLNF